MPQQATKSAPKIGDYEIVSKIGKGGIAEVFKGIQSSLQREVAIKVLSPQFVHDSDIVQRFERESIMIANLNHPNIVHVIDKGVQGGRFYFVMEYVDGTDFKNIIYNPNIDTKIKIEMIVQVCKALDYAHKNDVVHRDMKPANILIDKQGNAQIADFGIAQLRDKTDVEVTSSDIVMGTVAYMSPEQKFSSANVTKATDIYALGIILYEICCHRKPEGRFKMPSEVNSAIPQAMDSIISTCLQETPGDRFPTAGALKDALLNAFSGQLYTSGQADATIARAESFMGKCRFLDTIKEDLFGATYLVENKETKKLYIIKKNKKGDAGRREAQILSSLKHKNIINLLGAGGDANKTVVVSEYAQGGSLADRLVRTYSWKEAMKIIVPIAEGLEFAHKNNIVHGNLRPANILFDKEEQVRLTDFGLPPHYLKGKDWYAPPEKKSSRQGDMFSLGVILHSLLTNKIPQHDRSGNPYLNEISKKVPDVIQGILRKLLQIRAALRYKSFEELLIEYSEFIAEENRPKVKIASKPKAVTKKSNLVPALLILSAGIVGVLLAVFWEIIFK
ncbi:MAG: serine/threonine protein kinase [candidate division Zixibacteria bacterium]|nr:serine/threonine protein kinase [candidate division Zixibacteria bacterium]